MLRSQVKLSGAVLYHVCLIGYNKQKSLEMIRMSIVPRYSQLSWNVLCVTIRKLSYHKFGSTPKDSTFSVEESP